MSNSTKESPATIHYAGDLHAKRPPLLPHVLHVISRGDVVNPQCIEQGLVGRYGGSAIVDIPVDLPGVRVTSVEFTPDLGRAVLPLATDVVSAVGGCIRGAFELAARHQA